MEAVGLASAIFTFLDITGKIVARTREFLAQAENAPAFLKETENRLPLLEHALQLIKQEIDLQRVSVDLKPKLLSIFTAIEIELRKLERYFTALNPQHVPSKLQRLDRAFKSVLKYEGKIKQALQKLDGYTNALLLLQLSIVTGTTSRTEESSQKILKTLADNNSVSGVERERNAILAWIDGMPRDDTIDTCLAKRRATIDWIFDTKAYLAWCQSKNVNSSPTRFLWVHGPAGCGKTFTAAKVFECFEDNQIEVAGVFWRADGVFENAALDEIPRSWIRQLLSRQSTNYDYVRTIYKTSNSHRASSQEVWDVLQNILSLTTSVGITFFLDGLDVYREQQAKRARSSYSGSRQTLQYTSIRYFLYKLKDTLQGLECRFICFSQPDPEIRAELSPSQIFAASVPFYVQAWQYAITADDLKKDLETIAFEMMYQQLPKKSYEFWGDLARLVANQAEAHMSIRIMQREISHLNPAYSEKKLRKMLEESPEGFHDLYWTDLDRIKQSPVFEQRRAWRMVLWIAHALRPLSVQELLEAILIERDTAEFPDDDLPEDYDDKAVYGEIKELCGNLVTFDVGDRPEEPMFWRVRLAHRSAKDFVVRNMTTVPNGYQTSFNESSHADELLGSLCIRYLMCNNVWVTVDANLASTNQRTLPHHPLIDYATTYLHYHIQACPRMSRAAVDGLLEDFLDHHFDKYVDWHRHVLTIKHSEPASKDVPLLWTWSSRLTFAAVMGLLDTVQHLLDSKSFTSSELSEGLCAGCWSGSINIINALLDQGEEIDPIPPSGSPPLHVAAAHGQVGAVEVVLERGGYINLAMEAAGTALHCAIDGNHPELIRVLLARGADSTIARSIDGCLPVHRAVQQRNVQCLEALMSNDVRASQMVGALTDQGWSALGIAVSQNNVEPDRNLVKLLIKQGADPLQMFSDRRNVFYICAECNNYNLFEILAADAVKLCQASSIVTYAEGRTLLHAAIIGGEDCMANLVLDAGVDWAHEDDNGQTALDLALSLHSDAFMLTMTHIARTNNGIAYLANRATTSPPEDTAMSEDYMYYLHAECVRAGSIFPDVLAKHLDTCQEKHHERVDRGAKT